MKTSFIQHPLYFTNLALRVGATWRRLRGTTERLAPGSAEALDLAEFDAFVRRTARAAHQRLRHFSTNDAAVDEFVDSATFHMLEGLNRFTESYRASENRGAGDPFVGYCRRSMENAYRDLGRSRSRAQRAANRFERGFGADASAPLEEVGSDARRDYLSLPDRPDFDLCREDLEHCRRLGPVDGVIAFSLAGKWNVLPTDLGRQWRAACRLPAIFPTPEFTAAKPAVRKRMPAALLGFSRDAIYQRVRRLKTGASQGLAKSPDVPADRAAA